MTFVTSPLGSLRLLLYSAPSSKAAAAEGGFSEGGSLSVGGSDHQPHPKCPTRSDTQKHATPPKPSANAPQNDSPFNIVHTGSSSSTLPTPGSLSAASFYAAPDFESIAHGKPTFEA
jgi:hypothetical protein